MTQPAMYQYRMRATWNDHTGDGEKWSPWAECSEDSFNDYNKTPLLHDWAYETRKLFAEPFDIEPPRFAKRLIAQLRQQLVDESELTTKWYDRSVVLEQEKFKLTKPAELAVELERQLQEMTEILRNEREVMHRENLANAQHAGQMEYRNRAAIDKISFAVAMIDADPRGLRFIKVLEQLKTTLTK